MKQPVRVTCSDCGHDLPDTPRAPCPNCGGTKRTHHVHVHDSIKLNVTERWTVIRHWWERHPVLLPLTFVLVVGPPFLGLWLSGWLGVCVGLLLSAVVFYVGLRAITRVREIEHGGS